MIIRGSLRRAMAQPDTWRVSAVELINIAIVLGLSLAQYRRLLELALSDDGEEPPAVQPAPPPAAALPEPARPQPTGRPPRVLATADLLCRLRADYEAGLPVPDMAARYGAARATIYRYAQSYGWQRPAAEAANAEPESSPPPVVAEPEAPVVQEEAQAPPVVRAGMPAADDPVLQADLAEARQYIQRGWRAKQLSEFFGWELEFCQELCAAEGRKA